MPAPGSDCHRGRVRAWGLPALLRTAAAAWLLISQPALAVTAIEIEAREVDAPGVTLKNLRLRLAVPAADAPPVLPVVTTVGEVDLGGAIGRYLDVSVRCADAVLDEPVFGCRAAELRGRGAPQARLAELSATAALDWNLETGALGARGVWRLAPELALQFAVRDGAAGWSARANVEAASVAALRGLLTPWVAVPADISLDGRLVAGFDARGRGSVESANLSMDLRDINLSNEEGTVVGENVDLGVRGTLRMRGETQAVELRIDGARGQALAGPVLIDLGANPLTAAARGTLRGGVIAFDDLSLQQRNLSDVRGTATVALQPKFSIRAADIDLRDLRLPAAYTSFLQIALAATDFGTLETSGRITGAAQIENDTVIALRARLLGLELVDTRGKFSMRNLRGDLFWAPAGRDVERSVLTWTEGSAYGLSGGSARLELLARGDGIALAAPTRLPIFDGALNVRTLSVEKLGSADPALQFEADIEPISLQKLAPAFGWPELAGKLSGRIPRIDYRDKLLTVAGDVEARVFGGRIVGSGLKLQDPLGPWPRLFADVRAYDLDLAEVTQTFSIGSITGRIEGHVLGLELFNWSPVAFEAMLQTPRGDRGPHRISARAVGNLSNIGGGGGGVVQALQSGAFRMFDEYDYDRIGIRCRLANDVCDMAGIEQAGIGYYILKGKGLPRINIVGNAGRVSWPQLVSQVGTQMRGEGELRIE